VNVSSPSNYCRSYCDKVRSAFSIAFGEFRVEPLADGSDNSVTWIKCSFIRRCRDLRLSRVYGTNHAGYGDEAEQC